jgi:hypothetical protein
MNFNQWCIYIHTEAKKYHPQLLEYIVAPRIDTKQLTKILNAKTYGTQNNLGSDSRS